MNLAQSAQFKLLCGWLRVVVRALGGGQVDSTGSDSQLVLPLYMSTTCRMGYLYTRCPPGTDGYSCPRFSRPNRGCEVLATREIMEMTTSIQSCRRTNAYLFHLPRRKVLALKNHIKSHESDLLAHPRPICGRWWSQDQSYPRPQIQV